MPELNIEKTKKTLGQSIKRPPLSEKLLSKPPYRYLYDIMMEVSFVIVALIIRVDEIIFVPA